MQSSGLYFQGSWATLPAKQHRLYQEECEWGCQDSWTGRFLGVLWPCWQPCMHWFIRPDGFAAALNIILAEIYGTRGLKGVSCLWLGVLSKPSCVVLAWGDGNGGKIRCSCVSRRCGKELRAFKFFFSGILLLNQGRCMCSLLEMHLVPVLGKDQNWF